MNEKEQIREFRQRIVEDLEELYGHSPEEGLKWKSTKTDLIEMIHILFHSERIKDDLGLPATFVMLVNHYCGILHVKVPVNPRQLVGRAVQSKGIRSLPLYRRYKGLKNYVES